MDAERWQKIKSLFDAVQEIESEKRAEFLDDACGADLDLRREVERLIDSFENAESFMEQPAAGEVASMFEDKKTLMANHTTGNLPNGKFVAGTVLANRYRIIGLLGKGGMGEVFKAEDIKLNQTVALKFLPDKLEKDKSALDRFHAEVRNARQVSHINVCRVFDIGEIDGRHFLSMEFIDGDDLSSLLRRIGRLPSDKAIEISRQLCFGLAAIHEAGILHRDLKPANVIIDSKGKARITDFGIAGLEAEVTGGEIRVGTPAYMSPEQITGQEVSVKSDIYSLGLLLYEIFTGKQTFQADTIGDLLQKQQTTAPTNPSEVLKDIDPIVEKTILQCLEKNPSERPNNALQVAMMMPGGNPLEAAILAGETPSPEMVAAAPKKGALRPAVALTCLLGGIAMLVFCMFAAMKIAPHNRIPLNKSPEVLSERANEIVGKLGYTDAPAESFYRFYGEDSYANYIRQNPSPEGWEKISSGQPLLFVFVERQSPRNFDISQWSDGDLQRESQTASGMRSISLDTRGRLVEFSAVPPQFIENGNAPPDADFAAAFQSAELDLSKFKEVQPSWTPPHAFDTRKAWEGVMPDHADIPLRVEAASFQGKIVYFQLIYPWTKPNESYFNSTTTRDWIGMFIFIGVIIGIFIAAIFLARKNLKSGSGDRKGAFKTALVVLVLAFFGFLFGTNHVASFSAEFERFIFAMRSALLSAAATWLLYLALEPIVRRNLPELIVSWNRLLVGDWRDPLVGRDVLLGTLWGIGHLTLINAGFLAERFFSGEYRLRGPLPAPGSSAALILDSSSISIVFGFLVICFLVVLFLTLRRRLYAGLALFAVMATIQILFFTRSLIYLPFTLAISALWCLVIARLGLVATIVKQSVFIWMAATLFTLNFSAWYASGMFITVSTILALLAYGFYTSLAGQKIFEGNFLKDVES
ncbi:MAG: protein kinase [Acidobacteriota bacterium]|nr:protein kinase [Acidobacteriota bacterium]